MQAPDRATLVAALQRHGLAAAGADGLRRIGATLRGKTILVKREFGAVVDAVSGAQFGPEVAGSDGLVEMGTVLRAMRSDQRYACVHTHPEGFSFSPGDAAVLLSFPQVVAIVAVGNQGAWYVMSVEPGHDPPRLPEVFATFRRERDALAPQYEAAIRSGALTRREALRAHTHEIWEHIASVMGLRYDRVERGR